MRHALAAIAFLLCTLGAPVQAQDPAYVDGPAGNAESDPARADGGAPSPASQGRALDHADDERSRAEQLARTQEQLAAQIAAAQAAAAQSQQQSAQDEEYSGPPIGGRSMLREVERYGYGAGNSRYDPAMDAGTPRQGVAGATPAQQVGSALIQDAAGVADSHLQRKINGEYGRVVFPRYEVDDGAR